MWVKFLRPKAVDLSLVLSVPQDTQSQILKYKRRAYRGIVNSEGSLVTGSQADLCARPL